MEFAYSMDHVVESREAFKGKVMQGMPAVQLRKAANHPADQQIIEWMAEERRRADERAETKWRKKFAEWRREVTRQGPPMTQSFSAMELDLGTQRTPAGDKIAWASPQAAESSKSAAGMADLSLSGSASAGRLATFSEKGGAEPSPSSTVQLGTTAPAKQEAEEAVATASGIVAKEDLPSTRARAVDDIYRTAVKVAEVEKDRDVWRQRAKQTEEKLRHAELERSALKDRLSGIVGKASDTDYAHRAKEHDLEASLETATEKLRKCEAEKSSLAEKLRKHVAEHRAKEVENLRKQEDLQQQVQMLGELLKSSEHRTSSGQSEHEADQPSPTLDQDRPLCDAGVQTEALDDNHDAGDYEEVYEDDESNSSQVSGRTELVEDPVVQGSMQPGVEAPVSEPVHTTAARTGDGSPTTSPAKEEHLDSLRRQVADCLASATNDRELQESLHHLLMPHPPAASLPIQGADAAEPPPQHAVEAEAPELPPQPAAEAPEPPPPADAAEQEEEATATEAAYDQAVDASEKFHEAADELLDRQPQTQEVVGRDLEQSSSAEPAPEMEEAVPAASLAHDDVAEQVRAGHGEGEGASASEQQPLESGEEAKGPGQAALDGGAARELEASDVTAEKQREDSASPEMKEATAPAVEHKDEAAQAAPAAGVQHDATARDKGADEQPSEGTVQSAAAEDGLAPESEGLATSSEAQPVTEPAPSPQAQPVASELQEVADSAPCPPSEDLAKDSTGHSEQQHADSGGDPPPPPSEPAEVRTLDDSQLAASPAPPPAALEGEEAPGSETAKQFAAEAGRVEVEPQIKQEECAEQLPQLSNSAETSGETRSQYVPLQAARREIMSTLVSALHGGTLSSALHRSRPATAVAQTQLQSEDVRGSGSAGSPPTTSEEGSGLPVTMGKLAKSLLEGARSGTLRDALEATRPKSLAAEPPHEMVGGSALDAHAVTDDSDRFEVARRKILTTLIQAATSGELRPALLSAARGDRLQQLHGARGNLLRTLQDACASNSLAAAFQATAPAGRSVELPSSRCWRAAMA